MNVLGILGFGMNPAACMLKKGKCVAFAEEERFTRIKVSYGLFPGKAVAYCLRQAGISLNQVDKIAFGWDCSKYPWTMLRNFAGNFIKYGLKERRAFHREKQKSSFLLSLEGLTDYHHVKIRTKIQEGFRAAGFKGDLPEVEFVPHHLSHAYSTFFCSGFQKAGILTIDGHGEEICTQLAIGEGDRVRPIKSFAIPHSLGWFFAAVTEYLGFIPYRDEGKLMGLAALGEVRREKNKWLEPLSRILQIKNGSYEVDPIYTLFGGHYFGSRFTDEMVKLMTEVDPLAVPIVYGEKGEVNGKIQSKYLQDVYVDIAWAAQELLEQAAVMLARTMVNDYGVENICIAGGVGLNCKMNGEILRRSGVRNIFIQPASSDAGTALGAAMVTAQKLGANVRNHLHHAYLGPNFSNDEIRQTLNDCKLIFREIDDPAATGAELLHQGKIIAWFQGRMEVGARALGNRSILANPVFPGIKDRVNIEVKYREAWRPFCPSLIDEAKDDYIAGVNEAGFMIVAYHMKEEMKEILPAVVHVDGTIRPQIVTKESNALYHNLIRNLGNKTGHPVVLNTSFNVRGEPIICTPLEAVRCFFSNGLDALVIGNFLLEKYKN